MTRKALPAYRPFATLALPSNKASLALGIGFIAALAGAAIGAPGLALTGSLLAFALSWGAMVDLDRFILPDVLTLGLVVAGVVIAVSDGLLAAQPYLIGAAAGYFSLAAVAGIYRRLRGRNGLGMGDAKLLAAAGAWLGWMALPFVLLIASLACLVLLGCQAILRRQPIQSSAIPFGPYLAGAIWIVWLAQLGGRA